MKIGPDRKYRNYNTVVFHPLDAIPYCISISCLAKTGAGLLVLLVGSASVDERLMLAGLPLNPLILSAIICWACSLEIDGRTFREILLWQIPLLPLGFTILWSTDAAYGSYKFFNLLLTVNLSLIFFLHVIRTYGCDALIKSIIIFLLGLLMVAVLYKVKYGFFDRNVPFFIQGPITFARLMGLGVILGFMSLRGVSRLLSTSLFAAALLWTASKGPLLALSIAGTLLILTSNARSRWFYILFLSLFALAVSQIARFYNFDFSQLGRLSLLWTFSSDTFQNEGGYTSLTGRYWLLVRTFSLISSNYFGVGLGGWERAVTDNLGLQYPHNLIMELWSEAGILFGSLGLLSFFAFIFSLRSVWKYCAIFLCLSQLVSGDLLDARYLLVFSMLSYFGIQRMENKMYTGLRVDDHRATG